MKNLLNKLSIFNGLSTAMVALDKSNNEVIYCNQSMGDLLGLDVKDFVGENFINYFGDEDQERAASAIKAINMSDLIREFKLNLKKRSGKTIIVDLGVSNFKFDGSNMECILVNTYDVSELHKAHTKQKEMERALAHSLRMAEIGGLTSSVAHEFGNPLAIITGYGNNLNKIQPEKLTVEFIQSVGAKLLSAAHRMNDMVKNMRNMARQDMAEEDKKDTDLISLVQDSLVLTKLKLLKANVSVDVQSEVAKVQCLPSQIQQIILNIISNAADSYDDTDIENREIKIWVEENAFEGQLLLMIANNGPVIPPKILSNIFNPFFTTKKMNKGTGLGLSICHNIMQNHRGRIWASSDQEKGTVFTLEFLVAGVEQKNKRSILVVDDNMTFRQFMVSQLRREGFFVFEAQDGIEALAVLDSSDIEVLLTDINMPRMDGESLISVINNKKSELLVIGMSGEATHNDAQLECQRLGIEGFLFKPFGIKEVVNIVDSYFETQQNKEAS
ncbi:MAG: response regulator [Bdellovibrionaceae bacterium]|nr:response regulator [Pseudobdellovibrionaceae bacterium]